MPWRKQCADIRQHARSTCMTLYPKTLETQILDKGCMNCCGAFVLLYASQDFKSCFVNKTHSALSRLVDVESSTLVCWLLLYMPMPPPPLPFPLLPRVGALVTGAAVEGGAVGALVTGADVTGAAVTGAGVGGVGEAVGANVGANVGATGADVGA